MLRAGSGLATGKRADEAALDTALQAMRGSGLARANGALVFTSGEAHPAAHHVRPAVRRVAGAPVVVGASGAGVLTEQAEVEQVPAVAVLVAGGGMLVRAALVSERERIDAEAEVPLAAEVGATLAEGSSLLILPDTNLDPHGLLRGLADELGPVSVTGAVAAGAPPFEQRPGGAGRDGGAAGGGSGPGGRRRSGLPADRRALRRHAGRGPGGAGHRWPPGSRRAEGRDPEPSRLRAAGAAGWHLRGAGHGPREVAVGARRLPGTQPAGIDKDSGAVAVAGEVRVGQTIQFQIRDTEAARRDLEAMLARVAERLGDRPAALGVYFNCAGRGRELYGVPDHDVALIRTRPAGRPLIGVFGNGEFAPVGGANFFHAFTGVLVVLPAS
jgi:small ligand-binding sensory domain FIST